MDDLGFRPATRRWFQNNFQAATEAQALSWPAIQKGESTLLFAPTGSGKTLAAFLSAADRLIFEAVPPPKARCRVLYVSPLKSLAVDVERNLRAPLAGIIEAAREDGTAFHDVRMAVRTGDTPAKERLLLTKTPPDILLTTPESLSLMLTSSAREMLMAIDTVIIDEIHAIAATKRGAHFFLALERLEELRKKKSFQRIGLSATQRPLDEVARLLGGFDANGEPRPVRIVNASRPREFDLSVEMAPPEVARMSAELDERGKEKRGSQWTAIIPRLVELVKRHRTTMIFVNSRRLAERITQEINEVADAPLALAHHGSLARDERSRAEEALKRGTLPCIVATASMELGLDIGSVDLVIQIESPPSVASGLQRIGRSNHDVGGVPRGVVMPKHRGDLVACAAAVTRMRNLAVEETHYPRNPLDVLAQHVVAMVAMEPWAPGVLFDVVRRAACFQELPRTSFDGVLDMLSGRYPSTEFAELRPRIVWDRVKGELRARKGTRLLAVTNVGTIPERGLYTVVLEGDESEKRSRRVGELDEEMVFELREGEVILLGASSWQVQRITHERVVVTPAPGQPGKMPFWRGDGVGRSAEFGEAIGRTVREVSQKGIGELARDLDPNAQEALVRYIEDQKEATQALPTDRTLVVERLRDELGDWRVCVLSPYGKRVHIPLAMCIRAKARAMLDIDVEPVALDDGIALRFPDMGDPPDVAALFPKADEIEEILFRTLGDSSVFAARFREAAGRALLLPKRRPGKRTPLWAQRKRASDLLQVASRYPSFPILLETYRECMRDVFDVPALVSLMTRVEARDIRLKVVDANAPSPFAATILFSYLANFVYDGDLPLAERRAQVLTIDAKQLRELLGVAALRELFDLELLEEVERQLQRFGKEVSSADHLHDTLRMLGDLTEEEIVARAGEGARSILRELEAERRIISVYVSGEKRFVCIEEAGLYEQALSCSLPRGVPSAYRDTRPAPLRELVVRFSKTHGPFTLGALALRYGISEGSARAILRELEEAGGIVRGEFLPEGQGEEYCDTEVLRSIKRKTLAVLRHRVEPVPADAYARFLTAWHGIVAQGEARSRDSESLIDAIERLEGYPLTLSELEESVLPARCPSFRPADLDALLSSGAFRWVGVASSDQIALYSTERLLLAPPPLELCEGDIAAAIRDYLGSRGASFFVEIAAAVHTLRGDVSATLWEMVAEGEVTNDTLLPLCSKQRGRSRARPGRGAGASRLVEAGTEGRWSLVPHHPARGFTRSAATLPARLHGAHLLLARYGVLTREAVVAEGWPGGFSSVYTVLKHLEERGEVRRGMFIDGLSATQFALPGADERLRAAHTEPGPNDAPFFLSARDPANPYGATLPWPAFPTTETLPPQRARGAHVILRNGQLLAWINRNGALLTTVNAASESRMEIIAGTLANTATRNRTVQIPTIDGAPAANHVHADAFRRKGFVVVRDTLVYVVPRGAKGDPPRVAG